MEDDGAVMAVMDEFLDKLQLTEIEKAQVSGYAERLSKLFGQLSNVHTKLTGINTHRSDFLISAAFGLVLKVQEVVNREGGEHAGA